MHSVNYLCLLEITCVLSPRTHTWAPFPKLFFFLAQFAIFQTFSFFHRFFVGLRNQRFSQSDVIRHQMFHSFQGWQTKVLRFYTFYLLDATISTSFAQFWMQAPLHTFKFTVWGLKLTANCQSKSLPVWNLFFSEFQINLICFHILLGHDLLFEISYLLFIIIFKHSSQPFLVITKVKHCRTTLGPLLASFFLSKRLENFAFFLSFSFAWMPMFVLSARTLTIGIHMRMCFLHIVLMLWKNKSCTPGDIVMNEKRKKGKRWSRSEVETHTALQAVFSFFTADSYYTKMSWMNAIMQQNPDLFFNVNV